jgi:hypothetical protein
VAAKAALHPPLPLIAGAAAIAHQIHKPKPVLVPQETTEYVQTTEYRDKVVTQQQVVMKPTTVYENVVVQVCRRARAFVGRGVVEWVFACTEHHHQR